MAPPPRHIGKKEKSKRLVPTKELMMKATCPNKYDMISTDCNKYLHDRYGPKYDTNECDLCCS